MSYLPGLIVALTALWAALSAQPAPMFVGLGVISVLLAVWLSARLRIISREASPYHRLVRLVVYLAWLLFEVAKANVAVIGRILSPGRAFNPDVVRLRASARSDFGRALFANSITLTPGTVTLDVEGDRLVVHALSREKASPASFEMMDHLAARAADPPASAGKA
jgi:multicomponent Na+:H+ antiporter subunit E